MEIATRYGYGFIRAGLSSSVVTSGHLSPYRTPIAAACRTLELPAVSLANIRKGCVGAAGSSDCRWCSDVNSAHACRASAFLDPWRTVKSEVYLRRCLWTSEGDCSTLPESERCSRQLHSGSGRRATYSCQLDEAISADNLRSRRASQVSPGLFTSLQ